MKKTLFLVLAVLLLAGCGQRGAENPAHVNAAASDPAAELLRDFYSQYLSLSCPPAGEYPDAAESERLLRNYMTPGLYEAWQASHDPESAQWLDYDIFIQAQDCWPGIRVESITPMQQHGWYEVLVVQPASDNPDSLLNPSRVLFHIEKDDNGWRIAGIKDSHFCLN